MFTGLSLSGKTWLFNKINSKFQNRFFPLDSRSIHDYLNQFDVFKDDNTVEGRAYIMRQEATDSIQRDIVGVIAKHGYNIAHDSCNRLKKDRKDRLDQVIKLNPELKTVIIYVNTDREIILNRAKDEDLRLEKLGKPKAWEELFKKQNETYEPPSKDECNYLLEFNGSNEGEILAELEKILS